MANQCVPMPKPVQQEEEPQPCCSNQVPDRNELLLQKEMSGSKPMRSQRRPTCVEWAELENVEESTGSGGAEAAGDDAIDDEEDLPFPGFEPLALGCLRQDTVPRGWALRAVNNPWFDRLTVGHIG